jgi:protein-arginine deiminase
MILAHHNQTTEKVWVMELNFSDYSNMDMVDDMSEILGERLKKVNGSRYDYDVWVQDEFELSSMVSAESRMDLVIDSIRDGQGSGGLDDVPEDMIAGRNTIVRTWGSGFASTYDSFGNLEVSPAMNINGVEYPYGRVYYGKKGSNGPVEALTEKLAQQKVQDPFYVDTTWLCVGHIDEFTAFVPDASAPRGFRFVYADTRAGWDVLDSVDAKISLPRYASKNPYQGHGIATVGDMVNKAGLRAYNEEIQVQHLDPILAQFKEELALTDDEIILFPSVFHEEYYGRGVCGGVALVPGAVNMLLVYDEDGSSHAIMADPFFSFNS